MAGVGSSSNKSPKHQEHRSEQARRDETPTSLQQTSGPEASPTFHANASHSIFPSLSPLRNALSDGRDTGTNFAALSRASSPTYAGRAPAAGLAPASQAGTFLAARDSGKKSEKVERPALSIEERQRRKDAAMAEKATRDAEAEASRLASIPEERPPKAEVPLRRTPTPVGEKFGVGATMPAQPRETSLLERETAYVNTKKIKSFPDDLRQRKLMEARFVPLMSHENPALADYEKVSVWNARNREKARFEVQSHGGRAVTGGWPKLNGSEESKMRNAVREIDAVMRHPQIQVVVENDSHGTLCAKYRIPELHQEGIPGVENTGRGVMCSQRGLEHLMNPDGEGGVVKREALRLLAEKKARKAARNAR